MELTTSIPLIPALPFPLIPAKAGTQAFSTTDLTDHTDMPRPAPSVRSVRSVVNSCGPSAGTKAWVPASAGMSGIMGIWGTP